VRLIHYIERVAKKLSRLVAERGAEPFCYIKHQLYERQPYWRAERSRNVDLSSIAFADSFSLQIRTETSTMKILFAAVIAACCMLQVTTVGVILCSDANVVAYS